MLTCQKICVVLVLTAVLLSVIPCDAKGGLDILGGLLKFGKAEKDVKSFFQDLYKGLKDEFKGFSKKI
ncbi:hypothetical protein TNIN_266491 [Trichonephila inaurata madagascariensis]|uniref:Uncharacterized protein n=1 Tax=Trichonephila inaurata madagascariensis TaxID=2747483 RepID=A0A8X6Y4Y8_9ARAC|nr:hypothetical protein TNIN_266491 [Trichonephila inaurata madagascariensis]